MSNPYLEQWTSKEMLKELEEGILNAPQDLLGCHIFKEEDVQIFTAYRVQNVCGCWIQKGRPLTRWNQWSRKDFLAMSLRRNRSD